MIKVIKNIPENSIGTKDLKERLQNFCWVLCLKKTNEKYILIPGLMDVSFTSKTGYVIRTFANTHEAIDWAVDGDKETELFVFKDIVSAFKWVLE